MANSMFSKLEKLKNFIRYNTEEEVVSAPEVEKKEATINTKKDTEIRMCDCCNEQEIIKETSEMFKIDENGVETPLFAHPKENFINGGIYDEIAICDNCFSTCETDAQKQYVWIFGKMNSIHKEVMAKEALIANNNNRIEEIRVTAENEMRLIAEESNMINSEIHNLQNTIELYANEQAQLESLL